VGDIDRLLIHGAERADSNNIVAVSRYLTSRKLVPHSN